MVALGYAGGQRGCLGLQVAEAQRQGEGESEGVGHREGGGEQKEEDEEEAGDERRGPDGQKVLSALWQEAHLRQVGEAEVPVLVQDGRQVGQVQGEREERAAAHPAALLQPPLAGRQQKRPLGQQGRLAIRAGLLAAAAGAVLDRADRGGPLARVFPAPSPHFGR